jgi:hypothetical protein
VDYVECWEHYILYDDENFFRVLKVTKILTVRGIEVMSGNFHVLNNCYGEVEARIGR